MHEKILNFTMINNTRVKTMNSNPTPTRLVKQNVKPRREFISVHYRNVHTKLIINQNDYCES